MYSMNNNNKNNDDDEKSNSKHLNTNLSFNNKESNISFSSSSSSSSFSPSSVIISNNNNNNNNDFDDEEFNIQFDSIQETQKKLQKMASVIEKQNQKEETDLKQLSLLIRAQNQKERESKQRKKQHIDRASTLTSNSVPKKKSKEFLERVLEINRHGGEHQSEDDDRKNVYYDRYTALQQSYDDQEEGEGEFTLSTRTKKRTAREVEGGGEGGRADYQLPLEKIDEESAIHQEELDRYVKQRTSRFADSYGTTYSRPRDLDWACSSQGKKSTETWYPVMSPWQAELESLRAEGESPIPVKCFGCEYEDRSGENELYSLQWANLYEEFKKEIVNTGDMHELGLTMYEVFHATVVKNIRDRCKDTSNKQTRIWTPYGLMYHLLMHNKEPTLRQYILLSKAQNVTDAILDNGLFRRSATSDQMSVSKDELTKLRIAVEIETKLRAIDASKTAFSGTTKALQPNPVYTLLSNRRKVSSAGGTSFQKNGGNRLWR